MRIPREIGFGGPSNHVRWLGAPITTPLAADEPLTGSRQLERGVKDVVMRLIDQLMIA